MNVENIGEVSVSVTVMRNGAQFGRDTNELLDGNMIPRLCTAVGEKACEKVCQLSGEERESAGVLCAENNISRALESFDVAPENFVLAAATRDKNEKGIEFDNVFFGDGLDLTKARVSEEKYTQIPAANAFFFRPGIDVNSEGDQINAVGMRMADCGSVNYQFPDRDDNLVLGQAHFSRINMRGPSAYEHEINGEKVSWGEYVIAKAVEHYGADPAQVKIFLAAAVEGKDFQHSYQSLEQMENHFAGWHELGFMKPDINELTNEINFGTDGKFNCYVAYREMIEWQLRIAADRLGIPKNSIYTDTAINTGDISLGHASHHWASPPKSKIAHGRDLYMIKERSGTEPVTEFGIPAAHEDEDRASQVLVDESVPKLDEDPFIAMYELHMGHSAPPRELWDTQEIRELSEAEGYHPMTYWLMGNDVPSDPELMRVYDMWMQEITKTKKW